MAQSAAIPSVRQWRYARVGRRFIVGCMHDDPPPPQGGGDDFGNANALAKGTRLSEFEIERVLGEGGFAIVYLAFDHSLHRRVALKEYLPAEFAFRQDADTIVLRSTQHQKTFEAGRKSFVQEARFLAQFEHPSLVKVHRVFESNGTAYMVQGYYPGESLGAAIKAGRRFASEAELRPVVAALVSAVELLHSRQCLHRDIAPDNIIVQPNGVPVLLDFGAARRIIGDMTQALTAVLKPSYAPIEQYTEDGGMAQGPWTDVYALAATIRTAITGKPPPSSVGRTIKDGLVKLADDPPPNFDLAFLRGVDAGMALLPADRPQSMAEFRAALGLRADETGDVAHPPGPSQAVPRTSAPAASAKPVTVPASHAAVPPPPIRMETVKAPAPPPPVRMEPSKAPVPPPRSTAPRRRFKRSDAMLAIIAAAAIALMLVVPFAADWIWPSPSSTPRPQVSRDERAPAPPPRPAPAAVAPPAAAVQEKPPVPAPPPMSVAPVPPAITPPAAVAMPAPAKEAKVVAALPASLPAPAPSPPATAKATSVSEPAAPPAKLEAAAKPPIREPPLAPPPAPPASLIPPPAQPVALPAAPSPREEPPAPRPAAVVPAGHTAALPPSEPPKPRPALVRVSGDAPVYPREALREGIEAGRVVARVTVDAQGNVTDVDIVRSEPARVFDRAAKTALAGWKFRPPGERHQGEVELNFNLRQ